MPQETFKTIRLPGNWERPKYHLGQQVKQGKIIGLEYRPEGSRAAYQYGSEWRYTVMPHELDDAEDVTYCHESEIEPLTDEELREQIQAEIDFHQNKVATLQAQLREASNDN